MTTPNHDTDLVLFGSSKKRTRFQLIFDAQDEILSFAIMAAQAAEERGDSALSAAIMTQATQVARRWKIAKPGLPGSIAKSA